MRNLIFPPPTKYLVFFYPSLSAPRCPSSALLLQPSSKLHPLISSPNSPAVAAPSLHHCRCRPRRRPYELQAGASSSDDFQPGICGYGAPKLVEKVVWWKEYLPLVAMVLVQLGYAGMNIFSKAAMDAGMTPYVLVTYRQIFATVAIAPFAFFLERKKSPKMTPKVLYQSIFCSIFGATVNVFLYFIGLQNTTPTIACAADNTFPAITYIVGILVGMEKLKIRERAGRAKVFGTIVCVGGAMVLSFYHGPRLHVPQLGMHWTFVEAAAKEGSGSGRSSTFLGPLLVIGSCVSQAFWLMVQTKLSQNYPLPLTNTTLMCFWSIFPSMLVSGIMNHKPADWSLKSPIRLVSVLYAAIVPSAIGFWLMSWVAGKRGPLYVSIFNPLLLLFVAVLSWALLGEQLYVGTVLGAVLIIAGLYTVIWGKKEETKEQQAPKDEHVSAFKSKKGRDNISSSS